MTLVTSLYRLLSPYSNDLSLSRSGLHCRHKYYILKITFAAWWRFFSRCLALQQTSPPIRKDFVGCWCCFVLCLAPDSTPSCCAWHPDSTPSCVPGTRQHPNTDPQRYAAIFGVVPGTSPDFAIKREKPASCGFSRF